MNVCSVQFLIALLLVSALILHLPPGWRRWLLGGCNFAFLALWVPNALSWAGLLLFVMSGYAVAIWASRARPTARTRLLFVYLALLVIAFVILKEYRFLDLLLPKVHIAKWISIVGLSYILFRQIHFVVDTAEGQIERPSPWTYLNYQLNLFTLLAGPIHALGSSANIGIPHRRCCSTLTPN